MQIDVSQDIEFLIDRYAEKNNLTKQEVIDLIFVKFFSNNPDLLKSGSEFMKEHLEAFRELAK